MIRGHVLTQTLLVAIGVCLTTSVNARAQAAPKPAPAAPPALEPKAIEILKASSARLAAARTMRFTAVATTSAYNAGVAGGGACTAAATTGAYNAGVAAGSAATARGYPAGTVGGGAAAPAYAMGGLYPTLPPGCISPKVQGMTYYLCSNTWFQPSYERMASRTASCWRPELRPLMPARTE